MEQLIETSVIRYYRELNKEKVISFSFPVKGYEKALSLFLLVRKIYRKSFLHDFQNIFTSRVE